MRSAPAVPARQDPLQGAPTLLQRRLAIGCQPLRLGLEPGVDLVRGADPLVDVARLVAQVQHHAVLHGLVEPVGLADIGAENLERGPLVGLQQRRAGEADEHRVRQDLPHGAGQLARLRAVRLVDEDVEVARRRADLRTLDVRDQRGHLALFALAELVDQRADHAVGRVRQALPSGRNRSRAAHLVARAAEDILDLPVQLLAVGHHQDARIRERSLIQRASITMIRLFPEPWVCQMIPPSWARTRSCAAFTAKYWFTAGDLLDAGVEQGEVVDQLQEPRRRHHLGHVPVEARGDLALLLPGQPVGLRRLDRGVAQPSLSLPAKVICTVVKKCRMNSGRWLSRVWRMPSPTPTVDFFSSTDAERDAVDVEHEVGALVPGLGVLALDGDLFGDAESLAAGRPSRRKRTVTGASPGAGGDSHAVAEHVVEAWLAS